MLELSHHVVRDPGVGEVRVEVVASGLNRADVIQRKGAYPAPPGFSPDVPGLEFAGVVERVGERVLGWKAGDRVMGITGGGAMSTHVVAAERELLPVPEKLDLVEAAAIPEAFLTAFDAFEQAGFAAGETALVHAVGSGVGLAALQWAKAAGGRVIGTSRTADKLVRCREYGLDEGLLVSDARFADEVRVWTQGQGVPVVVDLVGGDYLVENLQALAPRGRIVVVGLLAGREATVPLGLLLSRRATVIGTVLRSRPPEEKAALAQAFRRRVLPAFASGRLRPTIDEVLPMTSVAEAHARLERGETFGKLVLAWT